MKKVLVFLFVVIMSCSVLLSCGNDSASNEPKETKSNVELYLEKEPSIQDQFDRFWFWNCVDMSNQYNFDNDSQNKTEITSIEKTDSGYMVSGFGYAKIDGVQNKCEISCEMVYDNGEFSKIGGKTIGEFIKA